LSELAAGLLQAARSPVMCDTHQQDTGPAPPVEAGQPGFEGEALQMGVVARPHQPAYPTDHPDRGDRAVGDLDVPIDLGAGADRPGDGGAHHGVVGEHDGHAAIE
jgi:hypothetical protein